MERTSDEAGKVSSRQVLCSLVDYSTSSWRCPVAERVQLEDTGGFPGSSVGKESAYSAEDLDSIPGLGGFPSCHSGITPPCLVTQSCLTLFDPMDCSPPGSSVHGDSSGKNTVVLLCPPPVDLPNPEIKPCSPALQADFFLPSEPRGALKSAEGWNLPQRC